MAVFPFLDTNLIDNCSGIKFRVFKQTTIELLQQITKFHEQLGLYYNGKKNKSGHQNNLVKSIRAADSKTFKENIAAYRKECDSLKIYQANIRLKQSLNLAFWQRVSLLSSNKGVISELKNIWHLGAPSNHLSLEALELLAVEIIPTYESFWQLGILELRYHKNKLSTKTYQQLKSYFQAVKAFILEEKRTVCNAMLTVLGLVSYSKDFYCTNVNTFVVNKFKQCDISLDDNTIRPYHKLSQTHFELFHNYIRCHGNGEQKGKLSQFCWFRNEIKYRVVIASNQTFVIPQIKIRQGHWSMIMSKIYSLFGASNHFWRSKLYLLAQIRIQEESKYESLSLAELFEKIRWQKIGSLKGVMIKELAEVNRALENPWTHILGHNVSNYLILKGCLQEAIVTNIIVNIQLANMLGEQLRTRIVFNLDKEAIYVSQHFDLVNQIIVNIDADLSSIENEHKELVARWKITRAILHTFITPKDFGGYFLNKNEVDYKKGGSIPSFTHNYSIEIKKLCGHLMSNNIFNLAIVLKYLPKLKFLLGLYGNVIKQDCTFWEKFLIAYIDTYLVIKQDTPILQQLGLIIQQYGSDEINGIVKQFNLLSNKKSVPSVIDCRAVLARGKNENVPVLMSPTRRLPINAENFTKTCNIAK